MAVGKGIVATKVGGIPDAVEDGANGLLVPARDAEALAGAIGRLLHDAEFRRMLGESAIRTISEQFDVRVTVARVAELYRTLYDRKRKHS
jgi:glycosyltransferase involved in cell wall biosynthesis